MTKFCTQCGTTVSEAARFCNKCGAPLMSTQPTQQEGEPTMTYQSPANYQRQPNYGQPPYQAPYQPPYQSPAANADIKPNVAALLCYPLSIITGVLFLVLAPYNKDNLVRFHAYQSIFFFVALVALNIVIGITTWFTPWFIDNMLWTGLRLLALGGTGWSMYQAYLGNKFKLPIIGDLADTQASKH